MTIALRAVRLGPDGPVGDVVVDDGLVASVGGRADVARADHVVAGPDLTVLPGLVDAHVHLTQWALAQHRVDVSAAGSPEELVTVVARDLAEHARPKGELVTAYGFRSSGWGQPPHGALFENALPGRPVLAISNDLHTAWFSPAAQRLLDLPIPVSGVMLEADALEAVGRLAEASVEQSDRWVLEALADAASRGVTGVIDFEVADNLTDWSRRAALGGGLPVRVAVTIYPEYLDALLARGLRTGDVVPGTGGRVVVGPLKVFVDGSLNARTALCHRPFLGTDDRGVLVTPPGELVALMARASRAGVTSAIHAIGDRAATLALDAFEAVGCPGRIEHAQLMRPADITRMAALGVVAGIQPMHALDDQGVAERLWGDRLADAFPHGSLLRSGVPIEIGSDAPVSPLDPWLGIAAAVHRTTGQRAPWQPEQRISTADALAAAAGGRTKLAAGDAADLVVVQGDPAHMTASEITRTQVVATVAGGRLTWSPR
jgi:predicted amidohydrolase YtcJ